MIAPARDTRGDCCWLCTDCSFSSFGYLNFCALASHSNPALLSIALLWPEFVIPSIRRHTNRSPSNSACTSISYVPLHRRRFRFWFSIQKDNKYNCRIGDSGGMICVFICLMLTELLWLCCEPTV
jgi:hypothetical protein